MMQLQFPRRPSATPERPGIPSPSWRARTTRESLYPPLRAGAAAVLCAW